MLWPEHLDPMRTVYPALGRVQCPVSILAGSDVSASDPTESIAMFIEDATKEFPRGRFERCALSLGPALPPSLSPSLCYLVVCPASQMQPNTHRDQDLAYSHALQLQLCWQGRSMCFQSLALAFLHQAAGVMNVKLAVAAADAMGTNSMASLPGLALYAYMHGKRRLLLQEMLRDAVLWTAAA